MKLHYSKILLFSLSLIILAHNKNKSYITIHTPITTSRLLIECNVYIPNYDNDPDMNCVRENFHKKTEQRFHEYDKRMIKNRQKCKEKCDKEIQKIILKDKMEKSLAEKVEKGCLMCGCGLGGVATSVGVLGTAVINVLKTAAVDAAIEATIADGVAAGKAAGHAAGATKLIELIKSTFKIQNIAGKSLESVFTAQKYNDVSLISGSIYMQYRRTCGPHFSVSGADNHICTTFETLGLVEGPGQGFNIETPESIKKNVELIVSRAKIIAGTTEEMITEEVMEAGIKSKIAEVNATYASFQNAIIASTVAILFNE
ncbi:PIR protein, putative [Plasmodium sp.]|nr:PIR protein, putative [Plasmodium sp.]